MYGQVKEDVHEIIMILCGSDRHPEFKTRGDKEFWARGSHVETIGNIEEKTLKRKIEIRFTLTDNYSIIELLLHYTRRNIVYEYFRMVSYSFRGNF